MKKEKTLMAFRLYEIIMPIVVFPLVCWLWLQRYDGNWQLALPAILAPVLFSYIAATIGIGRLKLWKIRSTFGPHGIRFQHGFLLGTMSSLFALAVLPYPGPEFSVLSVLRSAFVLASVLALWNWIYDIIAIKKGVLEVYNRQYADKKGAEAITTQYAPAFFGAFGLAYGASLRLWERYLGDPGLSEVSTVCLLLIPFFFMLVLPAICSVIVSQAYIGESGLQSYSPEIEEQNQKKNSKSEIIDTQESVPDSKRGDAVKL